MKAIYTVLLILVFSCNSNQKIDPFLSENKAKTAIKDIMANQEIAWNNHDLEGFMQGYWKNDSLKFFGSSGITYGWENTLSNYKKHYPSTAHTGTLKFVISDISKIENGAYLVFGEYHLQRSAGNTNGVFTVVFKYINGHWKIIADMSC